jgi:hypothetical protein
VGEGVCKMSECINQKITFLRDEAFSFWVSQTK